MSSTEKAENPAADPQASDVGTGLDQAEASENTETAAPIGGEIGETQPASSQD